MRTIFEVGGGELPRAFGTVSGCLVFLGIRFLVGSFRRWFERAKSIAANVGVDLKETWAGGVSDGNFAAALGVPTLDGLGVVGAGAHAETEHIVVDRLAERADFLLGLLRTLD